LSTNTPPGPTTVLKFRNCVSGGGKLVLTVVPYALRSLAHSCRMQAPILVGLFVPRYSLLPHLLPACGCSNTWAIKSADAGLEVYLVISRADTVVFTLSARANCCSSGAPFLSRLRINGETRASFLKLHTHCFVAVIPVHLQSHASYQTRSAVSREAVNIGCDH
jgi:hypothetical protein